MWRKDVRWIQEFDVVEGGEAQAYAKWWSTSPELSVVQMEVEGNPISADGSHKKKHAEGEEGRAKDKDIRDIPERRRKPDYQ